MIGEIFAGFDQVILEVLAVLIPLVVLFVIFQFSFLKLSKRRFINILKGFLFTFIGLTIFLQGVYIGFVPAGREMGISLASLPAKWLLIPVGFILGFVATIADPAVRVLSYQTEKASGGYIPQKLLLYTLSIGVGLAISVAMLRIIYSISLLYILIPGYAIVLILMRFIPPSFTAVAFDAGGSATGPMIVTFVLAITIGVASALEGKDPILEGFGIVGLVALASILTVQILGVLYGKKEKESEQEIAGRL